MPRNPAWLQALVVVCHRVPVSPFWLPKPGVVGSSPIVRFARKPRKHAAFVVSEGWRHSRLDAYSAPKRSTTASHGQDSECHCAGAKQ